MKKFIKHIKFLIKNFKIFDWDKFKGTPGDTNRGYVGLQFQTLAFDKQKHALGALPLTLILFGIFTKSEFTKISEEVWRTDLLTMLLTSFVVWVIGLIIEKIQTLSSNKNIDPYDAHIMLLASLFYCLFLFIWRIIRFNL